MVTNERKEFNCKKYNEYLEIINILGDKMMLQKHLIKLAIELGVAQNETAVLIALKNLEDSEIIKRINFMGSSNKIIIFRKYAIRYLSGATSSQQVAAVPSFNSNLPYLNNIHKVHIIIYSFLRTLKKTGLKVNLSNLLELMKAKNTTLLLNQNNSLEFYEHNLIEFVNSNIICENEFKKDCKLLKSEKENRLINLDVKNRDLVAEHYKTNPRIKKKPKTKKELLEYCTISTLLKKYVHIHYIDLKNKTLTINAVYFDLNNTQDCGRAVFNCALVYNMFKRLKEYDVELKVNFTTYTHSSVGAQNMNNYLGKRRINPITKEPIKETYLEEMLKKYEIGFIYWSNINFKVSSLGIDMNYLDGIKKANLINNK